MLATIKLLLILNALAGFISYPVLLVSSSKEELDKLYESYDNAFGKDRRYLGHAFGLGFLMTLAIPSVITIVLFRLLKLIFNKVKSLLKK